MVTLFVVLSALFLIGIVVFTFFVSREVENSMVGMLGFLWFFSVTLPICLFVLTIIEIVFYFLTDKNNLFLIFAALAFLPIVFIYAFSFFNMKAEERATQKTSDKYMSIFSDFEYVSDFNFIYENNNTLIIGTLAFNGDETKQESFKTYLKNKGDFSVPYFSNNAIQVNILKVNV